jgi:hypothetical protein
MHAEEPVITTDSQPAETVGQPAVDDTVSPTAAARSVESDQPALESVPEIVAANADSSAAGPPEIAAQPATNDDPAAASAPPPSQAGPAPLVPPSPVNPLIAVPPQNPRRKRRAKGWSCPVCRQRKRPRISILHSFFFLIRLLIPPLFTQIFYTSSLHILAADYDHSIYDGWRKGRGRKARLDFDHRPPASDHQPSASRDCSSISGSHAGANAGGARGACALAFVATRIFPRTLPSPC